MKINTGLPPPNMDGNFPPGLPPPPHGIRPPFHGMPPNMLPNGPPPNMFPPNGNHGDDMGPPGHHGDRDMGGRGDMRDPEGRGERYRGDPRDPRFVELLVYFVLTIWFLLLNKILMLILNLINDYYVYTLIIIFTATQVCGINNIFFVACLPVIRKIFCKT